MVLYELVTKYRASLTKNSDFGSNSSTFEKPNIGDKSNKFNKARDKSNKSNKGDKFKKSSGKSIKV